MPHARAYLSRQGSYTEKDVANVAQQVSARSAVLEIPARHRDVAQKLVSALTRRLLGRSY